MTAMLNKLNLDLQGKDKTIVDMISPMAAFKQKLKLVSSQLHQLQLRNFRNMMSELENQGKDCDQFDSARYIEQVQNLASYFDRRLQDIATIEPVATYMCFPFGKITNVEDIQSRMESIFNMDICEVENELLKLKNDIQIKSRATGGSFWNLLSEEKYPNVRKCVMYLTAFFGSTYLCESTFSHMKHIKSRYRSTMSDEHLDACLRLAVTAYSPNYTKLADNMQY
ncbi:general transcription factor II-I repeat domain-containing protein 2A-like [Homarus americanus]|uniref:general transcription factor II-I repeat domain-containing protein 2A-like n=1 Tax=Homarus americanus TaxID=6706 RepID=UPI001C466F30|nr:general transcription factor II-I repeat domain-containing protein 2A-like [Homarus americanus]